MQQKCLSTTERDIFFRETFFVYYESIKREPKIRGIYECRCDERLQTKTKKFTRLPYTGLVLELEHLKIETRLIDEKFANTMGEYVFVRIDETRDLNLEEIAAR